MEREEEYLSGRSDPGPQRKVKICRGGGGNPERAEKESRSAFPKMSLADLCLRQDRLAQARMLVEEVLSQ